MANASIVENTANKAQFLPIVPGPQKPIIQLLTGNVGFVGSLSDLIEKHSSGKATKNDYIDVIQDVVSVVGATAFIVSGGGVLALSAGGIIGVINYLDRNNWDINSITNNIFNMIDGIFNKNDLNHKEKTDLVNFVLDKNTESLLNNNNTANAYKDKQYVDFASAMKYFNEDGSVNFAQFLADTKNIRLYDPIALDLNNNGKIDTITLENGVFFDHNGDKVAFKSSWIDGKDGLLARDIDNDGKITSGAELFGNFTKLKNGELAKNGEEALKDLDDNNDGVLDENDTAFNQILVWQDKNSDGVSSSDELKSLSDYGIKSINLEFSDDNTALDKDNKQILVGTFNISSSTDESLMSDIDFSVNTIERNMLDSKDMGVIKGTGFVMDFDPTLSTELQNAYEEYKNLNTKEEQLQAIKNIVNL